MNTVIFALFTLLPFTHLVWLLQVLLMRTVSMVVAMLLMHMIIITRHLADKNNNLILNNYLLILN